MPINISNNLPAYTTLINENIFEIRKLHIKKISSYKIAKMFNVSKGTILAIINKKTWKHI